MLPLTESELDYLLERFDRTDRSIQRQSIAKLILDRDALLTACKAAIEYIPGSEVRNWPPGFELKRKALQLLRSAIDAANSKVEHPASLTIF